MSSLGGGLGIGPLGGMALGGASQDEDTVINSPESQAFRRAFVKRRVKATGLFEADWQEITEFVKRWGTLHWAIDDIRFNTFRLSGLTLQCRNDIGTFNREDNASSLWNGFLTRHRSLVRIEAGYKDCFGNEFPVNPTQGVFILSDEIPISARTNAASLKCKSLKTIFDEVRASEIGGLVGTHTASEVVTLIRDHTDGSGNAIFQQFITSGAFFIQTTTTNYVFDTTTSFDGLSSWDLMEQLAEAEGNVVFINRTGGFEFRDRTARTSSSAFSFRGQGESRQNIISLPELKEPWNKVHTFVRFKFGDEDTSTSFVTSGTVTSVDPDNLSWKFGVRKFEFENSFVPDTATAQVVADRVFSVTASQLAGGGIPQEIMFDAKMVPALEVLDPVDVSYRSYDIATAPLWDHVDWSGFNWGSEGENFDFKAKDFVVISKRLNLDNFSMSLRAKEV